MDEEHRKLTSHLDAQEAVGFEITEESNLFKRLVNFPFEYRMA